jgi:hypothetical protein
MLLFALGLRGEEGLLRRAESSLGRVACIREGSRLDDFVSTRLRDKLRSPTIAEEDHSECERLQEYNGYSSDTKSTREHPQSTCGIRTSKGTYICIGITGKAANLASTTTNAITRQLPIVNIAITRAESHAKSEPPPEIGTYSNKTQDIETNF